MSTKDELERAVIDAARSWAHAPTRDHAEYAGEDLQDAVKALEDWYAEEVFVERTWRDVRVNDTVRLPGTTNLAFVAGCVHLGWHVDPRSNTYRPEALEWSAVRVTLSNYDEKPLGQWDMDPDKPIEIQATRAEVEAIEAFGGWDNRTVGLTIATETSKP